MSTTTIADARFCWLAIVLACICSASEVHERLNLVVLDSAVEKGAVCLDGSPPAYYYRASRSHNSTKKWVLFFRGGAWCDSPENCLERAGTTRGSSKYLTPTMVQGGIMSANPSLNPDFFDWHHVFFHYCDGSSFSSNAEAVVNGTRVHYRGHAIMRAMMAEMFRRGIGEASDVLVSGCSAGALSVFLHIDEIAQMFDSSRTKVRALPGSGYFMDTRNLNGDPGYHKQMENAFYFQNCSGGVNQECVRQWSVAPHHCFFAVHTYPHIQTPLFVINSFVDRWQMGGVYGAGDSVFKPCALNGPGNCTQQQIERITAEFSRQMVISVTGSPTFSKPGNGVFLNSCWTHCGEVSQPWNNNHIHGVSIQQAVSNWYFDRPDTNPLNIDCYLTSPAACNPSCTPPKIG